MMHTRRTFEKKTKKIKRKKKRYKVLGPQCEDFVYLAVFTPELQCERARAEAVIDSPKRRLIFSTDFFRVRNLLPAVL